MPRADLHIHTRHSLDSNASATSIVARCLKKGLDCIAITDHNTIAGVEEVRQIAPFTVITGEEIRSAGGDIIGLFLQEQIPSLLSPFATAEAIRAQGGLVMVPHPFDRFRSSALGEKCLEEILPLVDIVESFNAHNFFNKDNLRAGILAQHHGLIESAVSDAHSHLELGNTYVDIPSFDGTPQGLKDALAQGTLITRRANPILRFASSLAKLKYSKAQ